MTWAWTPAGSAKPESKNVIMSMMIHAQAMLENVKTQLLDLALLDMQLRQRKAGILLGRVRDLDPRVAKCFLLKSVPAARFVLRFAHPVFSMNDSSTLTGPRLRMNSTIHSGFCAISLLLLIMMPERCQRLRVSLLSVTAGPIHLGSLLSR